MTDSIRERILDNVESALKTISVAYGYLTDVARVERAHRPFEGEDYPLVVIGEPTETYTAGNLLETRPDLIHVDMRITLTATIRLREGHKATPIGELMQDIHRALMADYTRGGIALNTTPVQSQPSVEPSEGLWGTLQYVWSVEYRHARTDPRIAG